MCGPSLASRSALTHSSPFITGIFTSSSIRSKFSSDASTVSASLPSTASSHTISIMLNRCRRYSRIKLESSTIRARIHTSIRTLPKQTRLGQSRRRQLLRIEPHHQAALHLVGSVKQPLPAGLQRARIFFQRSLAYCDYAAHRVHDKAEPLRSLIILHHQDATPSRLRLHSEQHSQIHRRQNLTAIGYDTRDKRRRHRHTLQVALP